MPGNLSPLGAPSPRRPSRLAPSRSAPSRSASRSRGAMSASHDSRPMAALRAPTGPIPHGFMAPRQQSCRFRVRNARYGRVWGQTCQTTTQNRWNLDSQTWPRYRPAQMGQAVDGAAGPGLTERNGRACVRVGVVGSVQAGASAPFGWSRPRSDQCRAGSDRGRPRSQRRAASDPAIPSPRGERRGPRRRGLPGDGGAP